MNTSLSYNELRQLLDRFRLPLEDEKVTQHELEKHLQKNGLSFIREYHLDLRNIIDFYFPDSKIGIEIKIGNATKKEIYRQVVRYCDFDEIGSVILLTNKSMGLPLTINNKIVTVLNIGKSWI